jgi:ankyrin repeat protein
MATLPARPNLEWLKKTAKQRLSELRIHDPGSRLADAQLAVARDYGFSSWRELKAHCSSLRASAMPDEATAAQFLRDVRAGNIAAARAALAAFPAIVNVKAPHPHWGGKPQPLHMAIEGRQRELFDLLLESGADPRGDNSGYAHWTPLMLAASNDEVYMRDELIRRGARVGIVEALMLGDDARVEGLLKRGRKALPRKAPGDASLLAFARTTRAIDLLLERGVPIDKQDEWKTTPIETFTQLGERGRELVRHLQRRGATVRARDFARLGDRDSVAAMAATDPSVVKDDEVLMGAVDAGDAELVQWLLDRGANPDARTSFGSRAMALHGAAWSGNLRIAKLLVAAGADIHGRDVEHQNTPAGYARVSRRITGNPDCDIVAGYLEGLERGAS